MENFRPKTDTRGGLFSAWGKFVGGDFLPPHRFVYFVLIEQPDHIFRRQNPAEIPMGGVCSFFPPFSPKKPTNRGFLELRPEN